MDLRRRIRAAVQRSPGIDVAQGAGPYRPDVAVVCSRALREGRARSAAATILVVDGRDLPQLAPLAGLTHGIVRGDLDDHDEIVRAIEVVARGGGWISPSLVRHVLGLVWRDARGAAPLPFPELTPREREVLELVMAGLSNSEIAGRLFVSVAGVKFHVRNVFRKYGCTDRAQLLALLLGQRDSLSQHAFSD